MIMDQGRTVSSYLIAKKDKEAGKDVSRIVKVRLRIFTLNKQLEELGKKAHTRRKFPAHTLASMQLKTA